MSSPLRRCVPAPPVVRLIWVDLAGRHAVSSLDDVDLKEAEAEAA